MTTHRYRLMITLTGAASPASSRERGFVTSTYDYLPGSVVRGALASRWIATHGSPDDDPTTFARHVAQLRVGPGLPVGARRVPLSVYRCKYPTTATCPTTAVDAAFSELTACPGCRTPLEASRGQWTVGPRVTRRTSTALGADETVADGQLFARDEIATGQTFSALATGDLDWLDDTATPLRLGGRRSVLGGALLRVEDAPPPTALSPSSTVVVELHSPAVFVDECGRTRLLPQAGDLERALRGTDGAHLASRVVVEAAWFRPDSVGGWNAAGGLPKATEATTAAGSVFRLRFPEPLSSDAQSALVERGLGARRADGLGWIGVVVEPWRPEGAASPPRPNGSSLSDGERLAAEVLSRYPGLVRKVLAWSREGYRTDPPGVAFSGQLDDYKSLVRRALAMEDAERLRFQIAAVASDWHSSQSSRKEGGR
jgi:CRISPR-associated protein Csx10